MSESFSKSYADAGVDVERGYESVSRMKPLVESTYIGGVLGTIGGFGGMFELSEFKNMQRPVTVSGADGVGTKLKLAFTLDKHDTIGIDCVAMCVNDIVCAGAKPLFFLDYIAMGKNFPVRTAEIVSGVAAGCREAGCALIGGECAEMPGFYLEDEYDLAGFAVGIIDHKNIIDGANINSGSVLIGIASSGLHSNGFSLVRKIFGDDRHTLDAYIPEFSKTLGEELLTPTRIYISPVLRLIERFGASVQGISHITGGGFYENVPRMLPSGVSAVIDTKAFPMPPVFAVLRERANYSPNGKESLPLRDMYNTFNMGLGLIMAVDAEKADDIFRFLCESGEKAYIIGECKKTDMRNSTDKIGKGVELLW